MKRILLAFLVLSLLLAPGGGESTAQLAGGPGGTTASLPDVARSPLTCFGLYLALQMACHELHCMECSFFWFSWERCDEIALTECQDLAAAAFAECLAGQGS